MVWGAAVVGVVALVVIVLFGLRFGPDFPDLYQDGGPTIEGSVAFSVDDDDTCVQVLDVATGGQTEIYCSELVWIEGWNKAGDLVVHQAEMFDYVLVIDPVTGAVEPTGADDDVVPSEVSALRANSAEGHATLTYVGPESSTILIDVDGPRDYRFYDRGITADENWVWVVDSENRLLVVATDGSSGPWLVADGVHEVAWK
jgi:hypothetical protein